MFAKPRKLSHSTQINFSGCLGVSLTLCTVPLCADGDCKLPPEDYPSWFTGSILAPTPTTQAPSHPAFEVVLVGADRYGQFDAHWKLHHRPSTWSIGPYLAFKVGFTKTLGLDFIGSVASNFCDGAHYTHPQDTILRLGFQVSRDQEDSWVPDFRIILQETFPSGHYDNFSPSKTGTDFTGYGSYNTGIHLAFQKLFKNCSHSWRLRSSVGYFIPSFVNVRGLNSYGGSPSTIGRVRPGHFITIYALFEYRLTHAWAIGLDNNYRQGIKGHATVRRGSPIRSPAFAELSVAPQIEHTSSAHLAWRIGSWISVVGKNTTAFATAFASITYVF